MVSVDINWHSFFFLLVALLTCAFALAVVISSNIVRMAFYLVLSLGGVAGLFFLAGADFLGGLQLLVYVGGTLVLLAFGVMLTARAPLVSMKTAPAQWVLAAVVGGCLLAVLLQVAWSVGQWAGPGRPEVLKEESKPTAAPLGLGLIGVRVDQLDVDRRADLTEKEKKTLEGGMSGYLVAFEVISVHLVVVLIGAAYLARAKRRVDATANRHVGETAKRQA
jgi:NADH:ubiquinone oxidoreductase subunit 6 (subunit J)